MNTFRTNNRAEWRQWLAKYRGEIIAKCRGKIIVKCRGFVFFVFLQPIKIDRK